MPAKTQSKFMAEVRSLATFHVEESLFKPDLPLVEKYDMFSAQLLRISLLGITIFGLLYKNVFDIANVRGQEAKIFCLHFVSGAAFVCFAVAAGKALFHRYYSTDAFACQIRYLRLCEEYKSSQSADITVDELFLLDKEIRAEHEIWIKQLKTSGSCLEASTRWLFWAGMFIAIAFVLYIFSLNSR
jgi:hypothetical protein